MKKTIVLLLAVFACQLAFADVVPKEKALRVAADFFTKAEVRTKASAVRPDEFKLVCTFPEIATKSPSDAPSLFVFERETGGYAVVSGDDVARPVLAYSLDKDFPLTDMPEGMRGMLQWYSDIIEYARSQHWAPAAQPTSADLDPKNTVQLETAQWNQGYPFNNLVAEINGEKPPIGCGATAVAIVMRYHKWPKRGKGTLPSYDYWVNGNQYHVDGVALDHSYDWDKMPLIYNNCSDQEAAQMARLLYDVAVMMHMEFYPGGSNSYTTSVLNLADFFDYDKQIRYYYRTMGFTDDAWEQLVRDDIAAQRPVVFRGAHNGGHIFVIDGYNDRYFSINYGWGGSSTWRSGHDRSGAFKDFYTLTPVEGHTEDLLVYYDGQYVVTHIMPNQGGEPAPVVYCYYCSPLQRNFEVGKTFYLYGYVQNNSTGAFRLNFRYDLYDRNGNRKEVLSAVKTLELQSGGYTGTGSLACKITKPLADGDQILLTMQDPENGQWEPLVQRRRYKIVFTDKSLSDMVELGYEENPRYTDTSHPERKRDIYLQVYKDVVFSLMKNDPMDSYALLQNTNGNFSSSSTEEISYDCELLNPDDPQGDTVLYEIWLPAGSYLLNLRNPLTGETMEITLEV